MKGMGTEKVRVRVSVCQRRSPGGETETDSEYTECQWVELKSPPKSIADWAVFSSISYVLKSASAVGGESNLYHKASLPS